MPLAQEDLDQITRHMKEIFPSLLAEHQITGTYPSSDIELRERTVRVEEELKKQRELMQQGFDQMEKRFEELIHYMDKRFGQVDKRFEELRQDTNTRFEELRQDTNARFEEINARFDQLNVQMKRLMIWSFGFTATIGGIIIGVLKFT